MVKVHFFAIYCFDNTKIQIPGFSIFGKHLAPDEVPCQALPLRCFVFESIKSKKQKAKKKKKKSRLYLMALRTILYENFNMVLNRTFTSLETENCTIQN